MSEAWPELPYAAWKDTCATLQLWTQIVGKMRLALTPWLNHSWHVTLHVTARGLGTPLIPPDAVAFQIEFDFHRSSMLWLRTSDGEFARMVSFRPMAVADFYAECWHCCPSLASPCASTVCRTRSPTPFRSARTARTRPTIPNSRNRFWRVLLQLARGVLACSAPAFSARPARCISSGAVSISR